MNRAKAAGGSIESSEDDALVVRGLTMAEIGDQAFDAGVVVRELAQHEGSLEEMFLAWTQHTPATEQAAIRS